MELQHGLQIIMELAHWGKYHRLPTAPVILHRQQMVQVEFLD
jgi:hypothetical protein